MSLIKKFFVKWGILRSCLQIVPLVSLVFDSADFISSDLLSYMPSSGLIKTNLEGQCCYVFSHGAVKYLLIAPPRRRNSEEAYLVVRAYICESTYTRIFENRISKNINSFYYLAI